MRDDMHALDRYCRENDSDAKFVPKIEAMNELREI